MHYGQNSNLLESGNQSDWKLCIESFYLHCRIRNLSPVTLDVYEYRLQCLERYCHHRGIEFKQIDRNTIRQYILDHLDKVSPETINGLIRSWRTFFSYLKSESLWNSPHPLENMKQIKCEKKLLPVLTPDQIRHVLHNIAHTPARTFERQRNYLMVSLFWDTMIRRRELLRLKIDDLNMADGIIKIHGKGRKQRYVPMGTSTIRLLHKFINFHRKKVLSAYLFCYRTGEPIQTRYIDRIFERISKRVGLKMRPHLIRHSAATWAIKQGMSPAILQKILGHSSIKTTETYLHISGQDIAKSYQKFSPGNALIE